VREEIIPMIQKIMDASGVVKTPTILDNIDSAGLQ